MLDNTNLHRSIVSQDKIFKSRGRILLEFMLDNNFSLVNGRILGDRPANFTFSNTNGNSVIDLVFCSNNNLSIIKNLEVLHSINFSDHFPVRLTLNSPCDFLKNATLEPIKIKKLHWTAVKGQLFKNILQYLPNVSNISNDSN